jgi:protein SCO1/2
VQATPTPRLALATITLAAATLATTGGVLLLPHETRSGNSVATALRAWCTGGDPQRASLGWAGWALLLVPALTLILVVLARRRQLAACVDRRPGLLVGCAIAAITLTGAAGTVLALGTGDPVEGAWVPAGSRRALAAIDQPLVDEQGRPFDLGDCRGQVTLVTSVFSRCAQACPLTLARVRSVEGALTPAERGDLRVVAISMEPERDTPARLLELRQVHGLDESDSRFVTGETAGVDRLLDELPVKRRRDATGALQHDSAMILLDREGRVAARFGIAERDRDWAVAAIRRLQAEPS